MKSIVLLTELYEGKFRIQRVKDGIKPPYYEAVGGANHKRQYCVAGATYQDACTMVDRLATFALATEMAFDRCVTKGIMSEFNVPRSKSENEPK